MAQPKQTAPDYASKALDELDRKLPKGQSWLRQTDVAAALNLSLESINSHCECGNFYRKNFSVEAKPLYKIYRQSVLDWFARDLTTEPGRD